MAGSVAHKTGLLMDHWLLQRRQSAIEHLQHAVWLRHVEWLSEVDSTNSYARRKLAEGFANLPALLVADKQTAGRGRTTRTWWSPAGCLMCSLVVSQEELPDDSAVWPQLSLVAGVAAAEAAETELPNVEVKLKWPNDLTIDDRKLAGILVEAIPLQPDGRMAFVIGIGLNVAIDWSEADSQLRARACSLSQFASQEVTVENVLIRFIECLQDSLNDWKKGRALWWQQWQRRSLLTGRTIHLQLPGGTELIGHCEGIDTSGRLVVRDAVQCHHIQSADVIAWQSANG